MLPLSARPLRFSSRYEISEPERDEPTLRRLVNSECRLGLERVQIK